jgi:lipoyl-dependent peroxiredoxin
MTQATAGYRPATGRGGRTKAVTVQVLYTAEATAIGGRMGRVRSSDGVLNLDLVTPKELGGPGGAATNPEQLFAAGYAACYENAVRRVARRRNIRADTSVTARVAIGPSPAGGYELGVELHLCMSGVDQATVRQLAEEGHEICPYSRATRGNIDVQIVVDPEPDVT